MQKLAIRNVSKTFSSTKALANVSLYLGKGELVSILGPSGCGKSTLLEMIAGLLPPDSGTIQLDGNSIVGKRGIISYMMQDDVMFPWRTVLDNVIVPLELRGVKKSTAQKEAQSLLKTFGLQQFGDTFPAQLSGGMRQRANLLRTYLYKKEIMLLDEPFGKLDALTKMQLQQWFLRIWSVAKKTVLFITHDVDEAIVLSDRIYILSPRPGGVVAEIAIPLRRPRLLTVTTNAQYTAIKKRVLQALELQ